MSTPIFPAAVWPSGINEASIPANDNALRSEALSRKIISKSTTSQPASPTDGSVYIIAATHTGAQWSTFTPNDITIYRGGTWYAWAPVEGLIVNLNGSEEIYTGGAWSSYGGSGSVTSVNDSTGAAIVETPLICACSDETTALVIGAGKVTFRMPFKCILTEVPSASLTVAQTSGSTFTVDINKNGTTIFTTRITIDNTEKTTATAAVAAVLTTAPAFTAFAKDDEVTIDLDQIGDGTAKGLKVLLLVRKVP